MAHRITALLSALLIVVAASAASAQSPAASDTTAVVETPTPAPTSEAAVTEPSDAAAPSVRSERSSIGEALWVSGLTVLVSTWALTGAAATTLVTVANGRAETIIESWIPVAGPWIMLGDSGGFDTIQLVMTTVSGILQTFSTAALIAGLVLVNEGPDDSVASSVTLLPYATQNGGGITIAGWF